MLQLFFVSCQSLNVFNHIQSGAGGLIGAPSIRLCLIHPGRGRAARRRTAANATDAIETKEGGWCWTSQTAIGWGPLPKRALGRSVSL